METFKEIFFKGKNAELKPKIKMVKIDRSEHAKGILNILKYLQPNFKITEQNKEIIGWMLDYFTGSENSHYDLNKGLFVIGNVGSGKTLLFDAFKIYTAQVIQTNSFIFHNAKNIIDNAGKEGIVTVNNINYIDQFPTVIYIDDIGKDSENVTHYGTKFNVLEQLFDERYLIFSRFNKLTHVSTNLKANEIKVVYGERIADRMSEMFNVVTLKSNESFRK